jgi:electron transfer flavoprotein alpha subunit
MNGTNCIIIFGEMAAGELTEGTKQLLRAGKKISKDLGKQLNLVFIGPEPQKEAALGGNYGADGIYMACDAALTCYMADSYLLAFEKLVETIHPDMILFLHNEKGMELAPRLAFRMECGVTLDCVDFTINTSNGRLDYVKPVLGGKAYGHYQCSNGSLEIATLREGAFDPADYDASIQKETIELNLGIDGGKVRTSFVKKEKDESLALALKLLSANIVVSGGRGVKNKEGMDLIQKLADVIGGAVCGSRPAVDNGWLPYSLQIGLTGKKISPQVYFAVGISGAIQHMAGCLKAKNIIAINSDQNAPIFRMSHIGVVGDFSEVITAMIEELR